MRNCFLLFVTAFVWGIAFVFQSKGMEYVKPFTFTAGRNALGALALLPFVVHKAKGSSKIEWKVNIAVGVCCGFALCAASLFQQYGVMYTTVGKAGFITTLYIIFTPVLGMFIGKRVSAKVWVGAVIAMAGLYLLCMDESLKLSRGDSLVLMCALVFSIHILLVDSFSFKTEGVVVACVQFLTCFVICTVLALAFDKPTLEQIKLGAMPILYAGFISSGVGYTLQIVGQKGVNPTAAALIMSLESVIAAIAGVITYKLGFLANDQTLSLRQAVGCAVVFFAVILVQLPSRAKSNENFVKT